MCSLCRPRSLQAAEDSIAAGDAEIARLEAQLKLLEEETTPQQTKAQAAAEAKALADAAPARIRGQR